MKKLTFVLLLFVFICGCSRNNLKGGSSISTIDDNRLFTYKYAGNNKHSFTSQNEVYKKTGRENYISLIKKAHSLYAKGYYKKSYKIIIKTLRIAVHTNPYHLAGNILSNLKQYEKSLESYHLAAWLYYDHRVLRRIAYDIACTYSLMKKKKKCYEFLNIAVFLGYDKYNDIKQDSKLNWLRQDSNWNNWVNNNLQKDSWVAFPKEKLVGNYLNRKFIAYSLKSGFPTEASRRHKLSGMRVSLLDSGDLFFLMNISFHRGQVWTGDISQLLINKKLNKLKLISRSRAVQFFSVKGSSKDGSLDNFVVKEVAHYKNFRRNLGKVEMVKISPSSLDEYMLQLLFKKRYRTKSGEKFILTGKGKVIFLGIKYRVNIQFDGYSPGDKSISFSESNKNDEMGQSFKYKISGNKLLLYHIIEDEYALPKKGKLAYEFKAY